uniref:Uncharacterized protein LOC111102176 n=1 Tax=Crassostrea virginica TaxID=6565 RepID=A0A8B8AH84_CRAVI|nr:uncharacterized protein LOC111102176 [Crassostrea virginica]
MFEDSQTSKQGWMNKINNEDFRQEFFGHQKRATLQLEERHINKKHVSEDFISFDRGGSTNGRRFTHKTIVLTVLVLSCVVVLAVAGTVIFIISKPDCNTSSLSTTTLSNLLNITAPTTIPSRRTTALATFSTTNSPQTKTTKISSATTAQTTSIKTSATTTTTPETTIEDSRDLRREWINMVTNKGFKREFNGHQIRATLRSDEKPFNKNKGWEDGFHSEHGAPTTGTRTKYKTHVLIVLTIACLVFLAAAVAVLFILTKPDHKSSTSDTSLSSKNNNFYHL